MIRFRQKNVLTKAQISEVVHCLKRATRIKNLILFGSYARGIATNDSDLDLVVILDEPGFLSTYMERVLRRVELSKSLGEIEQQTTVDILLYTEDEWKKLLTIDSAFTREILSTGQTLA
ncbi:MAG: nucleotidyltransferase domain-containing protein [Bacteroidota bacterium]|jgi:predicted nucleotidyltransferase